MERHGKYCRKYRRYCQYQSSIPSSSARLQWQHTSSGVIRKQDYMRTFCHQPPAEWRIHHQPPTSKHSLLSPRQLHSGIHSTQKLTSTMKGLCVNTTDMRRSFAQMEGKDGGNIPGLQATKSSDKIHFLRWYFCHLRPWQCSGRRLILCEYDARLIWEERSRYEKSERRGQVLRIQIRLDEDVK